MRDGHDLPILREQSSIGNVHNLQQLRIKRKLQGHGIYILRAIQYDVHCESGAGMLRDRRRVKGKAGRCPPARG